MNIDTKNNAIVVGPKESLVVENLELRDLNLLGKKDEFDNNVFIKVRSTGNLLKAKIDFKQNSASVKIIEGEIGISPGQACVFYSKDKMGINF